MAATAKNVSRTVAVGNGAATAFDARDAFPIHGPQNLRVTVVHATAIVSVAWNGITAPAPGAGDDHVHVGPFGTILVPWVNTLSLRSDTAATPVEVAVA